ncbi:MAG: NAD(P)-dependent oxidoreductase [candidate division Zixibacteria bacterium]|nr:NAD(P)-dependent oxidoreductase [candidate division Zixibacteria bacterium]
MISKHDYLSKLMTQQDAVAEASRCLGCDDAPCRTGCPAANDIVKFVRQIAQRNFRGAIKTVREANVLAGTCALICPVGELCEFRCGDKLERPIDIGALQRFVAEYERTHGMSLLPAKQSAGKSIGIIGSGPAGLSASFELARLGYNVEIHEAEQLPGGILTYGIPSYRLDPEIVNDEIEYIKAMGVKIITSSAIDDLKSFAGNYDAVFLGVGAYRSLPLNIKGEKFDGIFQASAYLKDIKVAQLSDKPPMINLGKEVIVIGGGNTAIDAALSARFSGSAVNIFYRRRRVDMPAFRTEIASAENNGVKFNFNYSPIEFLRADKRVEAVFCRNKTGKIDRSGRPVPVQIEGSQESFRVDNILIATGQGPTFREIDLIKTDKRGLVIVDDATGATSMPGVYAGGDAVNGGATAVQAVADGKKAAHGIDKYLSNSESNNCISGEPL